MRARADRVGAAGPPIARFGETPARPASSAPVRNPNRDRVYPRAAADRSHQGAVWRGPCWRQTTAPRLARVSDRTGWLRVKAFSSNLLQETVDPIAGTSRSGEGG